MVIVSRTPHGVRGLKFVCSFLSFASNSSHPAWGAWIEIVQSVDTHHGFFSRTPHGVRGLKSEKTADDAHSAVSHPAWGAWIEIFPRRVRIWWPRVAPRMGCVD